MLRDCYILFIEQQHNALAINKGHILHCEAELILWCKNSIAGTTAPDKIIIFEKT
jgi:hypothetical protein